MASLTFSYPGIFDRFALLSWRRNVTRKGRPIADVSPENARSRREFIRDMLTSNPDAFSSDLDVQGLMYLYSGRF